MRRSLLAILFVSLVLPFTMTGCGSRAFTVPASSAHSSGISGRVFGGQQPVTGATIQLYAAPGYYAGFPSTALLTTPVLSDGNGNWTITGDYTCPSNDPLVYVVASGGNPGLAAGTNNAAIQLMALLTDCNSLNAGTYTNINEVTTAAAVFALAPYMTDVTHIAQNYSASMGYPSTLYNQYATAQEYANTTTGTSPGTLPARTTFSVATLNTLADIIAGCVNSSGDSANDGSPCGNLFSAATISAVKTPSDTIGALIAIAGNPTLNIAQEFALQTAGGPFQPTLTAAPTSWSLGISTLESISTLSLSSNVMAASTQQVFAYANYNNATDVNVSSLATWTTSNAGIATVSSTGLVTALNPGTVTITATLQGLQSQTVLTVLAPLVSLSLTPNPGSVYLNQSLQYTLTGTYANGATAAVTNATFSSSNTNVATIGPTGIATGVALGTVTMTAAVGNVSTTAQLTVATAPVEVYPLLTSFTVLSCSYDPIIFSNCLFSFTAINLTPGTSYFVSNGTQQVCIGLVGGCIAFVFTATDTTYTSPAVGPTYYCGQSDVYGNPQPPPNICGSLSNGYENLSGDHDLAIMTVYRNAQDGPPLGYTTSFYGTPFVWP